MGQGCGGAISITHSDLFKAKGRVMWDKGMEGLSPVTSIRQRIEPCVGIRVWRGYLHYTQ